MESGLESTHSHEVRLVRCPKCLLLLPEPADVPVYKCGGCGTVLQVKNRKKNGKSTACGSHETDSGQMNEVRRVFEVGESNNSSQKAVHSSSGERSLDQDSGRDEIPSRDCRTANSGDANSLTGDQTNDSGESSSTSPQAIFSSSGEHYLDQNNGSNEKKSRFCSTENSGDGNSSDGDQDNESDHNESQDCNIKQAGVSNEFGSSARDAHGDNEELSEFAGANSKVELKDTSSLPAGANSVVDINSGSDSTLTNSNTDCLARRENNSTVASRRPAAESISSDSLTSSPDENIQMNVNLSYERTEFFSARSDFSSKTECFNSKCPTMRSSHDYDGSVSSYDGTDDHIPDQHINLHKNSYKVVNSVVSEEGSGREKFLENSIMKNYRKWDRDELVGSTGHGLSVSNGTRLPEEFPFAFPFYQRDYPAGYDSGSSSSQLQDEFHHRSSEQEKIKLLRMVYELKDQINKTRHVNEKSHRMVSSGVASKEKYVPAHYSCEVPEDEFLHDYYHRYPERWRQIGNRPHQHRVSRTHFSGEAINNSCHINCSCMLRYPQEWQYSAPLPPPFLSHNKGFCRFHPGQSYYSSSCSCSSSPQHFTNSEFAIWHHEIKSDDQRYEVDHMKKYMNEKHHLAKRYLRPTAGGAPFITCYHCFKPLQLPADFLLFKRRLHLLRCGACSEVLKFALEKIIHMVPYTPDAVGPPTSQLDDYNRRNSVSSSRGNDGSTADPVSCSDDYGPSYSRSCSTDGEPVILAPFPSLQGNRYTRNMSHDSYESTKERPQVFLKQSGNKYRTPVEAQKSAGHSSKKSRSGKTSSEIEELPAKTASPLHELMGYSSVSQVIRGSDPSSPGTSRNYT